MKLLLCTLLACSVTCFAERIHPREGTEWVVSYSFNATDETTPRVLLIGDSICNGYNNEVKNNLAGAVNVTFLATSKCVCDRSYLPLLDFMLSENRYQVIHFNNGLHSLGSNREDWERQLRAAIRLCREKGQGAKIIWASSTPLKKADMTEKAKELNAIAARVMKEEGVPTNDLFALMDPLDRTVFWNDTYHYKPAGNKMLAHAVSTAVLNALGIKPAGAGEARRALEAAKTETGPSGRLDTTK